MSGSDPSTAEAFIDHRFPKHWRAVLLGRDGASKSILMHSLMAALQARGQRAVCLNCAPERSAFGLPGTLSLGQFDGDQWRVLAVNPLCSLDAGRFRLPLLMGVRQLLARIPSLLGTDDYTLILDTPGLTHGIAAAELLPALIESANADVLLFPEGDDLSAAGQIPAAPPLELILLRVPDSTSGQSRAERRQQLSQQWQDYLAHGQTWSARLDSLALTGTPPDVPNDWQGRQLALYRDGQLLSLGQALTLADGILTATIAAPATGADRLLVRDAAFRDGQLQTVSRPGRQGPPADQPVRPPAVEVRAELGALTSVAEDPQIALRVGHAVASLVNGVMGDPLLQLRLLHHNRSLLFDLGDTGRMPLRAAHQVSDLFLTHAHADHIGGFVWFLRSRIGHFPPCRVFGPPGLLQHIWGMMNGILWDRVDDRGPCFEIHEWSGDHLRRWRLTAASRGPERLADQPVDDGMIVREPGFVVRATELDHGTPVLAYAYEPQSQIRVRKDRLEQFGLTPGPWLQQLKQGYFGARWTERIALENGQSLTVEELVQTLLLVEPGEKLAYATDFGASEENIKRLTRLARNAHTLFCESSFLVEDQAQADRTHHLTTEACALIANRARVRQLVAFHFSHRYEKRRDDVYRELQQYTHRVLIPQHQPASG